MVIHRVIFKNNQITPFPCFTFIPKTGVSFYCVKKRESVMWLFLKINLSTTISIKRSLRELTIDMAIHRGK